MLRLKGFAALLLTAAVGLFVAACGEAPTETTPQVHLKADQSAYDISLASPSAFELPDAGPEIRASIIASTSLPSLVTNGGFETATFAGWTVVNQGGGNGNWFIQSGGVSPTSGVPVPPPAGGTFAAMTDQFGPGSHILYQDLTVGQCGASLSFDLFIGNRAGVFFTPASLLHTLVPNQQFRMDIMTPATPLFDVGGGVLQAVYRTDVGALPIAGYFPVSASLDGHSGQTVRLRFAEVDNRNFFQAGVDNVTVLTNPLDVDVKPGSHPNPLNLGSTGRVPVAILSSPGCNAVNIDPATVTLGDDDGNDTPVAMRKNGTLMASFEDVDFDGDMDLVLHFETQALVSNGDLNSSTTQIILNGLDALGIPYQGSDAVTIVP